MHSFKEAQFFFGHRKTPYYSLLIDMEVKLEAFSQHPSHFMSFYSIFEEHILFASTMHNSLSDESLLSRMKKFKC